MNEWIFFLVYHILVTNRFTGSTELWKTRLPEKLMTYQASAIYFINYITYKDKLMMRMKNLCYKITFSRFDNKILV